MKFSIRRYILSRLTLVTVLLAGMVTAATYFFAWHEVEELFDAQLVQHGRLISSWMENGRPELALSRQSLETPGHRYERYVAVQHITAGGDVMFSSPFDLDEVLGDLHPGLTVESASGRRWHVFAQPLSDGSWLMVGEEAHVRDELSREIMLLIIGPYILSWPLFLIAVVIALRKGLRPLQRLEKALSARHENNLGAALGFDEDVKELSAVVHEIEELLARLAAALERERCFSDDAAHELRTLLGVLRIHSENALRAREPQSLTVSLNQLIAGITRAEGAVEQLLVVARLSADSEARTRHSRIMPVVRQTIADLYPLVEDSGHHLVLRTVVDDAILVPLPAPLIDILLRNLIVNALRHGDPGGGDISVTLHCDATDLVIMIGDSGPGVPSHIQSEMGRRYLRGDQTRGGIGLGLSIIHRILALCGGTCEFRMRTEHEVAATLIKMPLAQPGSGGVPA